MSMMISRYATKCCECGAAIAQGAEFFYAGKFAKRGRKTFCVACGTTGKSKAETETAKAETPKEATAAATVTTAERLPLPWIAGPHNSQRVHFTGPGDFAKWGAMYHKKSSDKWHRDSLTPDQCHQMLNAGDLSNVEKARALLDSFAVALGTDRHEWELSVAGAFPSVPDYLAGVPETMYQAVTVSDDRAPLRMVIDVTMSASVKHAQIIARGVALLALAMRLSERRPVQLSVMTLGGSKTHAWACVMDLPTQPLDLAHAAFALTQTAWTRFFTYAMFDAGGWSGKWAWDLHPNEDAYRKRVREVLSLSPQDIYIAPMHSDDPAVQDPIKFIRDRLAEYETLA
jgi:hypothetical protein